MSTTRGGYRCSPYSSRPPPRVKHCLQAAIEVRQALAAAVAAARVRGRGIERFDGHLAGKYAVQMLHAFVAFAQKDIMPRLFTPGALFPKGNPPAREARLACAQRPTSPCKPKCQSWAKTVALAPTGKVENE